MKVQGIKVKKWKRNEEGMKKNKEHNVKKYFRRKIIVKHISSNASIKMVNDKSSRNQSNVF